MSKCIKIGIVDDHKVFLESLCSMFDISNDIEVVLTASNGAELLDELEIKKPDLIILDLDMPVMSGGDALHRIRKKYGREIKVIILSMHDNSLHIARYMNSGANAYLPKSLDFETILEAIQSTIDNGYYYHGTNTAEKLNTLLEQSNTMYPVVEGDPLSKTELTVIKLLCQQFTCKEIGDQLNRSDRTIENHKYHIMKKIGAKNSYGIMEYAIINEIYELPL